MYAKYKRRKAKRRQHGGFLNGYDFAYAGRDTVNQEMKGLDSLAPILIDKTLKEIDKFAKARIKQLINNGEQQVQKIAPQIIRGAIKYVYKTPFRLLENLGKKKFAQFKRKFSKIRIREIWLSTKVELRTKFIMVVPHVMQAAKEN